MRKIIAIVLVSVMILIGCGKNSENRYVAGTYAGEAKGYGGDLTVEVAFSTNKIERIIIKSHNETPGIGTNAIDAIPTKIIKKNSTDVDIVSGATVTSNAIIDAVNNAMKDFTAPTEVIVLSDGVYPGEATGYQGVVKVDVTIKDERIVDIAVTESYETLGIGTKGLDAMSSDVLEIQSVNIDTLSGATVSSRALLLAVANAIKTAGGTVSLYNTKIEVSKGENQEITSDVVIIGAGGAGIVAAIEAKILGAESVSVIEKMDITGGNTRMSGGEFAAPNNWVQLAEGIKNDSIDKYYNDIYKGGYELGNPDLIRVIAENSLATAKWLKDEVNVQFRDKQSWYGGHEVARTLWPVGDGPQYMNTLEAKARKLGVDFYLSTRAIFLIADENNSVIGVIATGKQGEEFIFNANKGVIIATGGFSANVEMREKHNKNWTVLDETIPNTNSPGITGDGIVMGQAIGANIIGMENIQLYPVNNPATGNYYYIDYARLNSTALLVNKEGNRFVNEKGTRDVISQATLDQTDSMVYEIIDAAVVKEQNLYENYSAEIAQAQKQGVLRIGTIEEICKFFKVPANKVKATIKHYNSMVDEGKDVDFGRTDNFNKIGEGPYFMFSSVVSVHHTMGGLEIDTSARVIDTDNNPIQNLYAAGEVTGGIHGGNRLGSVAVPDTAIFGRIAAQSLMEDSK